MKGHVYYAHHFMGRMVLAEMAKLMDKVDLEKSPGSISDGKNGGNGGIGYNGGAGVNPNLHVYSRRVYSLSQVKIRLKIILSIKNSGNG